MSEQLAKHPYVICLIPARSGSQSVPDKNIKSVFGKPLMVYSIEHAIQAQSVHRVIVSTDSAYYAEIARDAGAETPFLRPVEISGNHSTDLEVFQHCLEWLSENNQQLPDMLVHLRPTCPTRNIADIDAMISLLSNNPEASAVRSVVLNPEPAFKMWFKNDDGFLQPVTSHPDFPEAYNLPRQALPPTYIQNASIDVVRTKTIVEQNSMTGSNILGYIMHSFNDLDYSAQFDSLKPEKANKAQTLVIDIDGVIAHLSPGNDYNKAQPNHRVIAKVNELFAAGHTVVLYTARGSKTGIDWNELTKKQLKDWGVLYHELRMGKPFADYYVDDRLLSVEKLLEL